MRKKRPLGHLIDNLHSEEVEGFDSLVELALDMRWSWNHVTDKVWSQLVPVLWEVTRNPWVVLQTVSREQIQRVLEDPVFRRNVDGLIKTRRQALEAPAWFQLNHSQSSLTCAAYFSMEFMLSEALPIYSGGLGNVAGDQLKANSDLGVPVVGVGLLYQQGYFRQVIDKDGAQEALYPYNDPGQMPVMPLRQPNGEWLRLEIALPGYSVWLRAWQIQVGRVRLYLLDSNDAANFPVHRGITSQLYGGGPELRLKQELLLGIGGWRLLAALGIHPEVCHLNEGHAAFAVLERARSFMQETRQPFAAALSVTRAGNLFTTHTAVAAGFDRFAPALIEQYLGGYAKEKLGITLDDLLALGRQNPTDSSESFNMAYLAIRGSGAVNGVSRLHGEVSRRLFEPLFPRWPRDEVPVGYVTNGVHMPSWDSSAADALWTEACGNLSELDGWWSEAYTPEVGWALGDGGEHGEDPAWDAVEADALYTLLEREVIPEFYTRDQNGIPTAWVKRMRESMARLTPRFSADRTVREYTEQHYLPSAAAYRLRTAGKGAIGRQMVDWQQSLEQKWAKLHFGEVKVETNAEQHLFEVQVFFNDFDPNAVRVELYADSAGGAAPVQQEMKCARSLARQRAGWLCLQRSCVCRPPARGVYGASETILRRRGGAPRSHADPLAAVI